MISQWWLWLVSTWCSTDIRLYYPCYIYYGWQKKWRCVENRWSKRYDDSCSFLWTVVLFFPFLCIVLWCSVQFLYGRTLTRNAMVISFLFWFGGMYVLPGLVWCMVVPILCVVLWCPLFFLFFSRLSFRSHTFEWRERAQFSCLVWCRYDKPDRRGVACRRYCIVLYALWYSVRVLFLLCSIVSYTDSFSIGW